MKQSLRLRRRQAIYVVPNLFTTGNLFCGLYAIIAVFNADFVKASLAILVARKYCNHSAAALSPCPRR